MTVSAVDPSAASATATQSTAAKTLAGNFDTFLTLLTTQLQNQDPTSPMDSNQFTQQLVEFSQVEQQINTNDNLKTLIGMGSNTTTANAVSYLGKAVSVSNGEAGLQDGAANWSYSLGTNAASTNISITNAAGATVYTGSGETGAGSHTFSWNGKDNNGNELADGTYKMTVTSAAADGTAVSTSVASAGVVSEVDLSGSEPMLIVGPMTLKMSDVTAIGNVSS